MQDGRRDATLATVSLPPLPARGAGGGVAAAAPIRQVVRPPTPPPRPESSLLSASSTLRTLQVPFRTEPTSPAPSGPGRGPASEHATAQPDQLNNNHISLSNPRPGVARLQNLYVDAPLRGGLAPPGGARPVVSHSSAVKGRPGSSEGLTRSATKSQSLAQSVVSPPFPHSAVISQQPAQGCSTLKKPTLGPKLGQQGFVEKNLPSSLPASPAESIICQNCNRCRCSACRSPRPLPQRWLCDNGCLCSAESALDTVSCMCCVKGVFYHCGPYVDDELDKEDSASCIDHPCSCSQNKWFARWCCLGSMSLFLPCLFCYPLLRGLTKGIEHIYQRATAQGCRCAGASTSDSQKRLLA